MTQNPQSAGTALTGRKRRGRAAPAKHFSLTGLLRSGGTSTLKRGGALALSGLVAFSGIATSQVLAPAPAHAEQLKPSGHLIGAAARPFYAYVQAGEFLYVDADMGPTKIVDPTSKEHPLQNATGGTYKAAVDGVWQVFVPGSSATTNADLGGWQIEARRSATGEVVDGRVWTEWYLLGQLGAGADGERIPELIDLKYWMVNDTGYQYEVDLKKYNGVNSSIRANSVGNTVDATTCVSAGRSIQLDEPNNVSCGEEYRIFFSKPAPDLPASVKIAGEDYPVMPTPLTRQMLEESTKLSYAAADPATGSAKGTFTVTTTKRFSGNFTLEIDVEGDDKFTGARDVKVKLASDGSGKVTYQWNGLDKAGNPVKLAGKKLNARVHFDKVGEMHIVQNDVEGRAGGIQVNREVDGLHRNLLGAAGRPRARRDHQRCIGDGHPRGGGQACHHAGGRGRDPRGRRAEAVAPEAGPQPRRR